MLYYAFSKPPSQMCFFLIPILMKRCKRD